MFSNKDYSNQLVYEMLTSDEPCMISRIGSTESLCLANYLGVKKSEYRNSKTYITGRTPAWWWDKYPIEQIKNWSGFFPADVKNVERFCELMLVDLGEIDLLGSWLKQETFFLPYFRETKKVVLEDLEPFFSKVPWTRALEGKKVLVVHPFSETIEFQYARRNFLFKDNFLPDFDLKTVKAVQTIADNTSDFLNWFDALDYMKAEIDKHEYDICIIGAGAYGLPLAAHVKRNGKKAFHLAGVTQMLFGIKGKRWEDFIVWPYENLFNEYWIRPNEHEIPKGANKVEGACYW